MRLPKLINLTGYRFIQVVQIAGKSLKSAFYNLVTYVEVCRIRIFRTL